MFPLIWEQVSEIDRITFKYVINDPFNPGLPGLSVPLLTEKDKSVRSVSVETYFKLLIMELFQLRFDTDYAWPQSGTADVLLNLPTGVGTDIAVFPFNTKIKNGSLYDIIGSGGFSFNVLPYSIDQKLLIVPQGGYILPLSKIEKKSSRRGITSCSWIGTAHCPAKSSGSNSYFKVVGPFCRC